MYICSRHLSRLLVTTIYITMFRMDGLGRGLADHERWGMSIKSTQLVLDYSEPLKRSRLNEEAFPPFGLESDRAPVTR